MLVEVATDAQRALAVIAQRPGLVGDQAVAAAAGLLGEIVGQEFELATRFCPMKCVWSVVMQPRFRIAVAA
jgi:hypothetical protein